jgi:hypothetical protein
MLHPRSRGDIERSEIELVTTLGGAGLSKAVPQPDTGVVQCRAQWFLQNNAARAENLVSKVKSVSEAVFIVQSLPELQTLVTQFPIQVGVVDLGLVTFEEIMSLRNLGMEIVCIHRTPDDVMWTDALDAGALDCCFDDDGPAICERSCRTQWRLVRLPRQARK